MNQDLRDMVVGLPANIRRDAEIILDSMEEGNDMESPECMSAWKGIYEIVVDRLSAGPFDAELTTIAVSLKKWLQDHGVQL